jgi:uncharacterized membrane protein YfcA
MTELLNVSSSTSLLLIITGLLAGFIDSIAGGGGLITLPVLTLILGAGPDAIGTNKIAGAMAAFVAMIVYTRSGHMELKKGMTFTAFVGLGALGGSLVSPLLPKEFFKWILFVTCPLILWVVWRKDLWVQQEVQENQSKKKRKWTPRLNLKVVIAGMICGFYDGVWGPGGGTFMFLSLLFFAKLPLFSALAASKLANTFSASVALTSYSISGHVFWAQGLLLALGISCGAFIGAKFATRNAALLVRPVLVVVVVLLIFRLLQQ